MSTQQLKRYQKRFASIESSFRIEGMDPSGDRIYEDAKARILSGQMTSRQALAYAIQRSAPCAILVATVSA